MKTAWPVLVAWLALLALETLCQISLKFAGSAVGAFDLTRASVVAALSTPWLWVAIGCYLGAFLAWMAILSKSTLSAAYATSAIVFVSVMIASTVLFGEPVHWEKALGSAIIVGGILMMGGERAEPSPTGIQTSIETGPRADGRTQ
ncbi:MAG TPA: EamA family transporter [Rhodanobacteraceae bacterium]